MTKARYLAAVFALGLAPLAPLSRFASAAWACTELTPAGLRPLLAQEAPTQVVFFASWCAECAVHLRQTLPPGTVLIAAFDERAAAEGVVKKLNVRTPCYLDQGIAAAYAIKAVPATLWLDRQGKAVAPVAK